MHWRHVYGRAIRRLCGLIRLIEQQYAQASRKTNLLRSSTAKHGAGLHPYYLRASPRMRVQSTSQLDLGCPAQGVKLKFAVCHIVCKIIFPVEQYENRDEGEKHRY
jgi:hypothetical protein